MTSNVDQIRPGDSRVESRFVEVGGRRWHYLQSLPEGRPKGTILLVHGFPDLSLAWRYQIPFLVGLGYRTLALVCMGYGKTGYSPNLKDYGFRSHATAISAVAKDVGTQELILGGHDWGGAVVYRAAQWLPELVTAVFSIATPFSAVSGTFYSTEELVRTKLPNFGYQLQFGSDDGVMEKAIGEDAGLLEKFLNGMYGGRTSGGRAFMSPEKGVDLDVLRDEKVGRTPLLDEEEVDFYVAAFERNPIRGPMNWYRTRKVNFEDELELPEERKYRLEQPVLFVQAAKDNVLVPAMSKGMEKFIPRLTRGEVPTGHWALWQAPERVNEIVGEWLGKLEGETSRL